METTKYPEDHKVERCFPKYGKMYLCFKYEEDFAFNAPITFPMVSCGVNSIRKCIWSLLPFISVIFTNISSAIFGNTKNKSWRTA